MFQRWVTLPTKRSVLLVGPRRAGKTTFLKTLLEQMEPLSGKLHFGHGVRVGYFAQAHETLRPQDTVIEALQRSREIAVDLRRYLGRLEDDPQVLEVALRLLAREFHIGKDN